MAAGLVGDGLSQGPQAGCLVDAAGGEECPVGTERHPIHGPGVAGQGAEDQAGGGVPQPGCLVAAAGGDE